MSNAAASALGRMIVHQGQKYGVPIVNIVRRQEQVDLLHSLGANYVLNSRDADFPRQLRTLAHDLKATLLLDAICGEQTQQLLDAAPFGSTVLVYGNLSGEQGKFEARSLLFEDKRVVGFFLPNWVAKKSFVQTLKDTRRVQQLANTDLRTTVQKRLPLSSVQQALEIYQNNMTAGKVLLVANPQEVSLD